MGFLSTILKVQLAKETGRKEGFSDERSFSECAQSMIDTSAKEEEVRVQDVDNEWSRVAYKRTRTLKPTWRRPETSVIGRDKGTTGERRFRGTRPRYAPPREERKCHGCRKAGHLVAQCPRTKCFECGEEGHIARHCPYIFRRREYQRPEPMEVNTQEVRERRSMTHGESGSSEDESSGTSGTEGEEARRSRNRRQTGQKVESRRWEQRDEA